jgi:linoleoyl-CoA desaturase
LLKQAIIKQVQFNQVVESDFATELKKRIKAYFNENNIQRHGGVTMYLKAMLMVAMFTVPLILMIFNVVSNPLGVVLLYLLSGLGMAGIGMGIMHDANHGSLSKRASVNNILSKSLDFMGCSSAVWKLQHNVLHHTFTNIQDHDEDIDTPFFLAFSPNCKKYWINQYQHIYIPFFYCLATLNWVTAKDFMALYKYRNMGLIPSKREYILEIFRTIGWKLFYYSYVLALPLIFNDVSALWIVLGFLFCHFLTGFMISMIFQLAHVMPDMRFRVVENQEVEINWYVHQLENTANFSPNSPVFSWLIGGLNFQIEHHLFPNICHQHYRKLSRIIAETAREYQKPYHVNKYFFVAVWKHLKMLRAIGKDQVQLA